jgi:hypothetical protein
MKLLNRLLKLGATVLETAPVLWVAVGFAIAGVAGFLGMVEFNQTSSFCMECHEPQGIFVSFDVEHLSHTPYKQDREACLTCHTDKDFFKVAEAWAATLPEKFEQATNARAAELPELDPGYTDAQCLGCHYDVLKLEEAEPLELSEKVAEIGLRFSHRRHFWMKDFPPEAAERLVELQEAAAANPSPTNFADAKKQADEIAFLQRAKLGYCGQCHDRERAGEVDRAINYFAFNPMRCTGCHTDAVRGRHPGTIHLALPNEETCRRCHTGSFHGRFAMFRAQCDGADKSNCSKCHPGFRPPAAPDGK